MIAKYKLDDTAWFFGIGVWFVSAPHPALDDLPAGHRRIKRVLGPDRVFAEHNWVILRWPRASNRWSKE
jgi:hypothetical protein